MGKSGEIRVDRPLPSITVGPLGNTRPLVSPMISRRRRPLTSSYNSYNYVIILCASIKIYCEAITSIRSIS